MRTDDGRNVRDPFGRTPLPFRSSVSWRILVAGEDPQDREVLRRHLERHGHEVRSVASGTEALAHHADADLVLVDLDLVDVDGLEVCRSVRETSATPIIAVSERNSELDTVLSLQAGADGIIVKPYGVRELLARVEALMRRARPGPNSFSRIEHGPLLIDVESREVTFEGRIVSMTKKEFDLLYMLASQPGTIVSRRVIMQQIWGDSWSRRTVDTHVSSLRGKLGASDWIVTVRGVGFMLGRAA
ncbi:response regulator transcription factor [Streptomyces sp. NBC_01352]|nr:response regulator transcription factor [Streptomyces sp. NBC_01373]